MPSAHSPDNSRFVAREATCARILLSVLVLIYLGLLCCCFDSPSAYSSHITWHSSVAVEFEPAEPDCGHRRYKTFRATA